ATPGPDGSFFSGSIAFGDKYPVTPGAFQTYQGGGAKRIDIAITRFNADATARIYSTYLGGSDDEYPHSLFSDPMGNLVVMGRTYSTKGTSHDFPGTKIGPGGDADILVTKLNATGTGIIGSLVIGGKSADGVNIDDQQQKQNDIINSLIRNYGDDSRSELILDNAGNIYVAAQTHSVDFPIIGGVFQSTLAGKQDGVVLKINPSCTAVTWSSFLGGSDDD